MGSSIIIIQTSVLEMIHFVLLLLANFVSFSQGHAYNASTGEIMMTTRDLSEEKETVHIGVYNNIVGYLNWQEPWFTTYAANKCNTKCIFSLDPGAVKKADIVVFLASTFNRKHPPFPKKAKPDTVFVLHTMEQPLYAKMLSDEASLRKKFDLIATYNQDPTYPKTGVPSLPLTYFPLHIYKPEYLLTPPLSFSDKTGYGTGEERGVGIHATAVVLQAVHTVWCDMRNIYLVCSHSSTTLNHATFHCTALMGTEMFDLCVCVYTCVHLPIPSGVDVAVFISNCKKAGGQNRLKYVKEMMEHIPMHSYGGCLSNRKEKVGLHTCFTLMMYPWSGARFPMSLVTRTVVALLLKCI